MKSSTWLIIANIALLVCGVMRGISIILGESDISVLFTLLTVVFAITGGSSFVIGLVSCFYED